MAKSRRFKGSSIKHGDMISMYGVQDLLKKLEEAGKNVDDAIKKSVDASLELVGMKMQLFLMGHRETGETYRSYGQVKAEIKDNKVSAIVGYNAKKGGLPSIFLDVGTPKQKPYFFRYYAVENSTKEIQQIQRNTLNDILKGLE